MSCKTAHIKAVGDICAGDASIDGFGVLSMTKKHDTSFPFGQVGNLLDGADILVGNLEGPLSAKCHTKDMRMCGLPEIAGALKYVGFDAVSVANNHIFDHGLAVFDETISALAETGLKICGLRGKQDYCCEPVILEKQNITFGLLAYNFVGVEEASKDIGKYIAVVEDSVVNYTWNRVPKEGTRSRQDICKKNKCVLADIRKLKKKVDFVILLPHWGFEWTILPPFGVVMEARSFVDAGADLILGCHPHVPQGLEKYNNGLIYYSLGNFLFDMCSPRFRNGLVADVVVSEQGIENFQYYCTTTNSFFQPVPASEAEQEFWDGIIRESSSVITSAEAEKRLDDEIIYREYEEQYRQLKFDKIRYLLLSVLRQPKYIKPILSKTANLLLLLAQRARGRKIRW